MLYAIATWLITSTPARTLAELEPPAWPPSLRAERRDGGVWLDGPTAKALHVREEFLDRVPGLGREILTYQLELKQTECDGQRAVDAAAHASDTNSLEANQATLGRKLQWIAIGVPIGAAVVLGGLAALGAL